VTAAPLRPVDMVHLARYTGGDAALNAEVFALFVGQATELMSQLESVIRTGDTKQWRHVTHTVKGAARGIGAFGLADAAASAEPIDPALDAESAAQALRQINAQAESVRLFIAAYLGR
jgi:HPt (histidine-containing phosphotransfer) domain-containing protein